MIGWCISVDQFQYRSVLDAVTRVVLASVGRILKDQNHILQIFDVKNVALIKNVMMEILMVTCGFVMK